ncbi:MFS transporter [Cellulomonas sp. ATA003]|uniref:MFS transporter n=1 Tax=Cellulomonas sp. ATA003 TaxID=3073064 RepID=UPI002873122B|nr:MFS transporter [Cellulomonas sp. ATA003]WNB85509.1 MFS transporter [Cellulomonas sp. ATA003]
MLRPYRDVLSRPGALAFSMTGLLARLPIAMVGIGIVLMISTLSGSYGLAGRVSAVYVIANAVCGPRIARLVDRHGQARVMRPAIAIATLGLGALVVAALVEAHPVWLYATAVLAGAPAGSFGALVRARWSHVLTDPRQVHTAYSLESAFDEVVFVIGPVLATVLATSVAPAAGLVVPMVAAVVGGYAFLSLRGTEPPPRPLSAREVGAPPSRAVMRSRGMVVIALVFVAVGAMFGATDVSTVAFAEEQGSKGSAGFVLAAFAMGSLIAGLGYGARHWLSPLWQRFVLGVVALAVGVSFFLVVTSIPALAVVMFVTGFAIAPTLINGNGLVQQLVAPSQLTEGLTWVATSLGVGVSLGSSVAGVLIDRQGAHGGFTVVVVAATAAVVVTLLSAGVLRADSSDGEAQPVTEPTVVEAAAAPGHPPVPPPGSPTAGAAVASAPLPDAAADRRAEDGDDAREG